MIIILPVLLLSLMITTSCDVEEITPTSLIEETASADAVFDIEDAGPVTPEINRVKPSIDKFRFNGKVYKQDNIRVAPDGPVNDPGDPGTDFDPKKGIEVRAIDWTKGHIQN